MPETIRIPHKFFDDHAARELPTPDVVRSTQRHYWIRADDPALAELLDDARYYAGPHGPSDFDGAYGLRRSARATVKAIEGT